MRTFSKMPSQPNFASLEKEVSKRWYSERTFEKSLEIRKGCEEFIFYDGPPFPTGSPHHGTIFVSILKDVVPRFKTMSGYYVPRRWGWDCHGLPIETQAEKNLGIKEKKEIETTIGVRAFNAECRRIVSHFNDAWKIYIERIGRWVDMENAYRTLDVSFMESVIWAFAESYKKELIYKGYRVTPYCYRCETPLSISDARADDATRPRQDRAITVRFKVEGLPEEVDALAWTTTPWTLPSNLALGVNPGLNYVIVKDREDTLVLLAEENLSRYVNELGKEPKIIRTFTGQQLVESGARYKPLFPYFKDEPNAFKFLAADFVSAGDGTGIVHLAPGFGEDDFWTCKKSGINVIVPVDDQGSFKSEITDFAGRNVHESNSDIARFLRDKGRLFHDGTIEHNYPHCWRCRTPLIYRAVDAWYYDVEKIKPQMLKNNQEINWCPSTIKDGRFGHWLEGARDWNISRNRYWGTPIPVWECTGCNELKVIGSIKELHDASGTLVDDLHKEVLDEVTFACSCGKGTMKRVPEVLDGWFESGSMPYGQEHYPFENVEHFKSHFPADFIVEYVGQVRCWFYNLHVLSTGLFDRPAFKGCLVHGTLLAADGKKISKSLKNYTDPLELMDKYGADAMRGYLLGSQAVHVADLWFSDKGVEEALKSVLLPYWNALSFLTIYGEADGIDIDKLHAPLNKSKLNELERFILSETEILVEGVGKDLESYSIHEGMRRFPPYLDTLTNWFIRRSRSVVWASGHSEEKLQFYQVLHRVLSRVSQVLAPYCPFITENGWKYLGYDESIHLTSWPVTDEAFIDRKLSQDIALVRSAISAGLALRARHKLRVRQPLSECRIFTPLQSTLEQYINSITEELNIKSLTFVSDVSALGERIVKADSRKIGKRLGGKTQPIIDALKRGEFTKNKDGSYTVCGESLDASEVTSSFVGKSEDLAAMGFDQGVIEINVNITPALKLEGKARDVVRQVQEARKLAALHVSDHIVLHLEGVDDVVGTFSDYLMRETLTKEMVKSLSKADYSGEFDVDGSKMKVSLARA